MNIVHLGQDSSYCYAHTKTVYPDALLEILGFFRPTVSLNMYLAAIDAADLPSRYLCALLEISGLFYCQISVRSMRSAQCTCSTYVPCS